MEQALRKGSELPVSLWGLQSSPLEDVLELL